jgi:hypothetical protein
MTIEFGDIEEDDVFADEGEPAPEQVAIRLHESREDLQLLVNDRLKAWQELSEEEQQLAFDIGVALVQRIAEERDAGRLARWLHELRESIDSRVPPWSELDEDEHAVAQALLVLILTWLSREGSIR